MSKTELRQHIRALLQAQSADVRAKKSRQICEEVLALPACRRARTIMCYVALPHEVNTAVIIDQALQDGQRVAVPVMETAAKTLSASLIHDRTGALVKGPYGVMQPADDARHPVTVDELDLIVVPGVAFTRQGQRLGQGKGYYDRFLHDVPRRVPRIGLAFACQLVDALPSEPHDETVDQVLSA